MTCIVTIALCATRRVLLRPLLTETCAWHRDSVGTSSTPDPITHGSLLGSQSHPLLPQSYLKPMFERRRYRDLILCQSKHNPIQRNSTEFEDTGGLRRAFEKDQKQTKLMLLGYSSKSLGREEILVLENPCWVEQGRNLKK